MPNHRNFLKIYYCINQYSDFSSNIISTNRLVQQFSEFASLEAITFSDLESAFKNRVFEKDSFFLHDMNDLSIQPYLFRMKYECNIPFIFILRTVWGWLVPIIQAVPLMADQDVIVATSDYAKDSFERITGAYRVCLLPHGLDIKEISSIRPSVNDDVKQITFMGRISPDKGIREIIDVFIDVEKEDPNIQLNIIGALPGQGFRTKARFIETLKAKIAEFKLEKKVIFHGLLKGKEKYDILKKSDIFLNPTTFLGETFGITTIEALACGVPVIATRWAANAELIDDSKTGFLVETTVDDSCRVTFDTNTLKAKIQLLLSDDALLHQMKINALAASQKYDKDTVMLEWNTVLSERLKMQTVKLANHDQVMQSIFADLKDMYKKDMLFFLSLSETYQKLFKDVVKDPISDPLFDIVPAQFLRGKTSPHYLRKKALNRAMFKYICGISD